MSLAVIDFIFIGVIALFTIRGYLQGLISGVLSIAALLLGVLASIIFHESLARFLREQFIQDVENIAPEIISFIVIFLVVGIAISLIKILLKGIINTANLGGVDRILGLFFGFAQGFAVVGLLLFLLGIIQPIIDTTNILQNSLFASHLMPVITRIELPSIELPPLDFQSVESLPNV